MCKEIFAEHGLTDNTASHLFWKFTEKAGIRLMTERGRVQLSSQITWLVFI